MCASGDGGYESGSAELGTLVMNGSLDVGDHVERLLVADEDEVLRRAGPEKTMGLRFSGGHSSEQMSRGRAQEGA
jgi:hypothetical protein